MENVPPRSQSGYTLTELVIVIGLIALIASVAVTKPGSSREKQVDQAVANFAAAIRYARSESMRTGQPHGFRFLTNQYRIRVFSADTTGSPWTWIWDVYHPVDKNLFDYTFPADLAGSAAPVVHTPVYRGTCDRQGVVYFNADGTPWCLEPETVLLESYQLDIATPDGTAVIRLDGITGRVTVQ